MTDTAAPGFELRVHGSLCEPITLGGAPRAIAVLNGTLAAIIGFGLQAPVIGVPLFFLGHGAASYLSAQDPHFFAALRRHASLRPHLGG